MFKIGIFFFMLVMPSILHAKAVKIVSGSDLDFGIGAPGDSSKQIPPGTSENAANASFSVTGNANRAYLIALPTSPIAMTTGNGPNSDSISVSNFNSFPSSDGLLNASGSQIVFVGATRDALKLTQKAGLYSGQYSVTVVY